MSGPQYEKLEFSEKSREEMIARARDFYLEVKRRRSVRDFSPRPVPRPAEPTSNRGISWWSRTRN
jgi:hypothetical protein